MNTLIFIGVVGFVGFVVVSFVGVYYEQRAVDLKEAMERQAIVDKENEIKRIIDEATAQNAIPVSYIPTAVTLSFPPSVNPPQHIAVGFLATQLHSFDRGNVAVFRVQNTTRMQNLGIKVASCTPHYHKRDSIFRLAPENFSLLWNLVRKIDPRATLASLSDFSGGFEQYFEKGTVTSPVLGESLSIGTQYLATFRLDKISGQIMQGDSVYAQAFYELVKPYGNYMYLKAGDET